MESRVPETVIAWPRVSIGPAIITGKPGGGEVVTWSATVAIGVAPDAPFSGIVRLPMNMAELPRDIRVPNT